MCLDEITVHDVAEVGPVASAENVLIIHLPEDVHDYIAALERGSGERLGRDEARYPRCLPPRHPKHIARYVDEFTFRLNDGSVKNHTLTRRIASSVRPKVAGSPMRG